MSGPPVATSAPPRVWHMYRAMVGVGLGCALLIVSVYQLTGPIIARNRAEALQAAIFQVLPEARSSRTVRGAPGARFDAVDGEAQARTPLVHAGYDEGGRVVGLALEAEGMGYQDVIRILYGYAFERDAVVGIQVLESRETPGLGDKIATDPAFLGNFEHLDVSLDEAGATPLHPIESVKHGDKQHPWQVDGITGATISSVAIATILRNSTAWWIPRLRRSLDDFREAP
jgi:electron transport complex protein RnfG